MGNFHQHMRCSTATGVVYGGIAYACGVPVPTALLAGGMCSAAGMLPDIDSDTSQSFRECIYLAAGVSAVLATMRAQEVLTDSDMISLVGASVFFFVRFVVGSLICRFTSHRGMFHSIPAAIIAGEIAFLVSAGTVEGRLIKAGGLVAGFLSHLILDEVYSFDLRGMRVKKSFGTAFKFVNLQNKKLTAVVYFAMIALGVTCLNEPQLRDMLPIPPEGQNSWEGIQQIAQSAQEDLQRAIPESFRPLVNNLRTEIEQAIPEPVRVMVTSTASHAATPQVLPETTPPLPSPALPAPALPSGANSLATFAPPQTLEPAVAASPDLFPKRPRSPAVLR